MRQTFFFLCMYICMYAYNFAYLNCAATKLLAFPSQLDLLFVHKELITYMHAFMFVGIRSETTESIAISTFGIMIYIVMYVWINREYFELRASSSIPAAFIARVPIVATRELLDLYPCIRDMPIHRRLNLRTSCESIAAALSLTSEEYSQAQQELLTCGTQLWDKSREVFNKISW